VQAHSRGQEMSGDQGEMTTEEEAALKPDENDGTLACYFCGMSAPVSDAHPVSPNGIEMLFCRGMCVGFRKAFGRAVIYDTKTIAVKYDGQWFRPDHFLTGDSRTGIHSVGDNERDRIALELLNIMARSELQNQHFVYIDRSSSAKIFWVEGWAAGYYSYTTDKDTFPRWHNIPTIHQLYVVPEYRRQGLGTLMTKDFVNEFKHCKQINAESPNRAAREIWVKIGLAKRLPNGRIKAKNSRLGFIYDNWDQEWESVVEKQMQNG
jgi:GNAT superfamily N-acetyltransferase